MPCQHYKDALIKVAARGAAPQGELRAHVDDCASCRAAFDEGQSLFTAIDSALHSKANAEIPSSLLPRVRASIKEVESRRFRWARPLIFASASVALAVVIFLIARPGQAPPENLAVKVPAIVPPPVTAGESASPESASASRTQIVVVRVSHPRAARNSTNAHSAASSDLEVLVPPDEREGLAQFVATLSRHRDVAAAFLAKRPENKDTLVTVDRLQIPDIEIKPLDGTESETSDGAGEKHR